MSNTNSSAGPAAADLTKRSEFGVLTKIALPLIAAYAAEYAMFTTTKIVVGQNGFEALAAVGLAGDLAVNALAIFMGLFSVVGVLVAQAEGAGNKDAAGLAARQGFALATGLGLLMTILVWNLDSLLALFGQEPGVVADARPYVQALASFALPALWFSVLRSIVAALARTGIIMVITVAAIGLNYALAFGLVNGAFGLPALGVAGAGWATAIVHWLMAAALILYIYLTPSYRGYGFFRGRLKIVLPVCGEIMRLGLPVAGLTILEVGIFSIVAILSGLFGAVALAAYQVVQGWIWFTFVFAHGIAESTMVRVAHGVGRGSPAGARQAGLLGIATAVILLASLTVIPLGLPDLLVRVFLDPGDPGYVQVSDLVVALIVIAVIFQVFDGLQIVAAMALRGIKDTAVPFWIAAFGYWVMGFGGGYLLAFPLEMETAGLWWGLALGLIVTGCLLTWRFHRLTALEAP